MKQQIVVTENNKQEANIYSLTNQKKQNSLKKQENLKDSYCVPKKTKEKSLVANKNSPVAFLDTGIGGLCILNAARVLLPYEDFVYLTDTIGAPYGNKPKHTIATLTLNACNELTARFNPKAIVLACNTATAAAISRVRGVFKGAPIIGIEPAIRPAILQGTDSEILVLSTVATLKYSKLMKSYRIANLKNLHFLALPKLATLIDQNLSDLNKTLPELNKMLSPYKNKVSSVVLGCSHYAFIKPQISLVLGGNIKFFDSSLGAARRLKHCLTSSGLMKHISEIMKYTTPDKAAHSGIFDTKQAGLSTNKLGSTSIYSTSHDPNVLNQLKAFFTTFSPDS